MIAARALMNAAAQAAQVADVLAWHRISGCHVRSRRSPRTGGSACAWHPHSRGSCRNRSSCRASWSSAARSPTGSVDRAPPARTNSPPPLTMVFLAMPPDLLCMGLFCKKQFRVPPPSSALGGTGLISRGIVKHLLAVRVLRASWSTRGYHGVGRLERREQAAPRHERAGRR
jgi:hypothetical protein